MPKWIRLDSEVLNPPTHETHHGVDLVVFLSAYDVPEGVSGSYDDETGKFSINFKYIVEDEPMSARKEDDIIAFRIGKNSGRLYGIEIDVKRAKAKAFKLAMVIPDVLIPDVENAINKLESNPRWKNRLGNYRLAKKVIAEKGGELLSGVR